MKLTPQEYRLLLRKDLYAFIERCFYELNPTTPFLRNWHIEVVAAALEACRRGETRRLITNLPPRSLKSHCVSVAFVAFVLGHDPAAQIICASYGQDLANKHALDCRRILTSPWYRDLFRRTRLSQGRQAVQEYVTTQQGFRLATSVGGVLTGRGADYIVIDDPLKPDEALSETQRVSVNDWFKHSLYSRLNDKQTGRIIIVAQRLHQDDLVGHVLKSEPWTHVRLSAIAEEAESYTVRTPYGPKTFTREAGDALHPKREPIGVLQQIRENLGEYNYCGQYLQQPAPLGGGMVKIDWFRRFEDSERPKKFEMILQSWDTASKASELNDFSVCTTWGIREKQIYLLHVRRGRYGYPDLKRAVQEQAEIWNPRTILIEDAGSGIALAQELLQERMHSIETYSATLDKTTRLHSVTAMIENGFVYIPANAPWLGDFIYELSGFPKGKFDDQVDSLSMALDWFKLNSRDQEMGAVLYGKYEASQLAGRLQTSPTPAEMPCSCGGKMSQPIPGGLRCMQCGLQWLSPRATPELSRMNRTDALNSSWTLRSLSRGRR